MSATDLDHQPVFIVTGTTASGKNRVGARVAARLGGEVISLDSMKVYRGMDIGTAKPDASERAGVPHHLVDLLDPQEPMDLRRYVDLVHAARADLAARDRRAVLVGGTQLYLRGLLAGVFAGPPADAAFRAGLRAEATALGAPALHARLAAVDPVAATRIHPNDYKRIERALEVSTSTGRALTDLQREGTHAAVFPRHVTVLTWERPRLMERIDARVRAMFAAGWVDEVRHLLDAGGLGREAGQALGYPEILAHLRGELDVRACDALVAARTRLFARKQLTWLRKLSHDLWIDVTVADTADSVADRIASAASTWLATLPPQPN